jgi:hypothetical protein
MNTDRISWVRFGALLLWSVGIGSCARWGVVPEPELTELDRRHERIREFIGEEMYGPGGLEVLEVAHRALREKWAMGEGTLVGLEDVWAHALQEGLVLFNQPDRLWGRTTAAETGDMIGQTTVGPWQMTVWNIRDNYGPRYGVQGDWTNAEINAWCRERPEIQAKMIIDYIQLSYELFERRTPYAIQRYFWLEPYVRGEIGQAGDWTKSPVARPPEGGTWEDITPEMKRDTGFYAKQVLLGTHYTKSGLLFWLVVTGDTDGARETLRTWRDQRRIIIVPQGESDAREGRRMVEFEEDLYVWTNGVGGFVVGPEDVIFAAENPEIRDQMMALIEEVILEVITD